MTSQQRARAPATDIAQLVRQAKLEVKKAKRKNYYKILEVSKTATDSEIKKAYRKLALVHHPGPPSPARRNPFFERTLLF